LELVTIYPRLRVVRRDTESGLSTAVIRGWELARGEILGVIDAQLQHPPESHRAALEGDGKPAGGGHRAGKMKFSSLVDT
jgi:glycosyltransferase involved in cell wall biosynthesis